MNNQVNLSEYDIIKLIGIGSYFNIYIVKNKITKKNCAAKICVFDIQQEEDMETQFQTSLRIYCTVHNPAFVKFLGYSETDFKHDNHLVILTEYMENGSLFDAFKRLNHNIIPKG